MKVWVERIEDGYFRVSATQPTSPCGDPKCCPPSLALDGIEVCDEWGKKLFKKMKNGEIKTFTLTATTRS